MLLKFRNYWRSIKIFLVLFFIIASLLFIVYKGQQNLLESSIEEAVRTDLKSYSSDIDNRIAEVISDVLLLERLIINSDLFAYEGSELIYNSLNQKVMLEKDLYDWIDINTEYDQIRFLNTQGLEMIRVNSNGGNPDVVDASMYQNKSGRYYFENAIDLSDETIYLSKIDLNIENGEIEYIDGKPKQMLRIGTTVYNNKNEKIGLIIVNYLADNLFHDVDTSIGAYTTFEAINEDGFYLHNVDESIEYGFMFKDKQDEVFNKYHEFDVLGVESNSIHQEVYKGEIYTSLVINKIKMSESLYDLLGKEIPVYSDNGQIILVGEVEFLITEQFQNLRATYFTLLLVFTITVLLITRLLDEIIYTNEEKIDTLEYSSNHDELTGLVNRKRVFEYIQDLIDNEVVFSLMFLDLDGFKRVNDEFGHQIGDQVLIDSSQRINSLIRDVDILSRLGGDEFLIVLTGTKDTSVVERVNNKVKEKISHPFVYENVVAKIGVSIGVAVQDGTLNADTIVKLADKRMYEDKEEK